ncbi:DUF6318 family protein [Klenkia sesuvii]|uniref:DUF6318 family protein n=1 Tax=Klenkia sesuvii TaxID=3103137 RepID=UPI0030105A31
MAGLALTGCSDPGTPSDTLPTAASTSAEPTLEPLGPADFPVPPEAREQTEAGAAAFVRYYIQLINRAQSDLDVQYLDSFSQGCETCAVLSQGLRSLAEQNFTVQGGAISIVSIAPPTLDGAQAEFVVSLAQDEFTVLDAAGAVQQALSAPAAEFPASGGLTEWSPQTSSWQMTQLTVG